MRKHVIVALVVAVVLPVAGVASAASGTEGCDYNGDGFDDLFVGVPGEDRKGVDDVGTTFLAYGSAVGVVATGGAQFHQGMAAVRGTAGALDTFGQVVACGDFNGDGYDDVAVGVPGDAVGGNAAAGAVNVLYGSASGLSKDGDQRWHQDLVRIDETAEAFDFFGSALATGDFNNDGFDDLAIGVPGEDLNGFDDAGLVHMLRGTSRGLTSAAAQIWHEDVPNVKGVAETGDAFGHNLVTGDFDGDGFDDLAISAAFEDLGRKVDGGMVHVLLGFGKGLTGFGDQMWHQDSPGVMGRNNPGDLFGDGLAAGDFNGDGFDDLAIGVPGEDFAAGADTGMVNVLMGSAASLTADDDSVWHLGRSIPGQHTAGAHFGFTLAAGDVNNDGRHDLLVGVPGETADAGSIRAILGSTAGLTVSGAQAFSQGGGGLGEIAEPNDRFGGQIVTGDFNGDGFADAAVGALGEDDSAGVVTVLPGNGDGLTAAGSSILGQDTPFVADVAEAGDQFGALSNPSYQLEQ
jgi:hypothetical protein